MVSSVESSEDNLVHERKERQEQQRQRERGELQNQGENQDEPDIEKPKPLYSPHYAPHYTGDSEDEHATRLRKRLRRAIGLDPEKPLKPHEAGSDRYLWSRIRTTLQEPFSEFLGTMVLALFYNGSLAQSLLGATISSAPGGYGYGEFASVAWGSGIGSMMGIYVSGDSGAYLNPAITFTNCMFRGLPWRQYPITVMAQFLGAFVGLLLVYGNYVSAIDWYSGHGVRSVTPAEKATASILTTFPQTFTGRTTQVIGIITPTMLTTILVFALKDDYNNGVSKAGGNFFPLAVFFLNYGLTAAFGFATSGAVNPALDLTGRVVASIVGYPSTVWTSSGYYFWLPVVLPYIGTTFGGFLYDLFVYTGPSPVNSKWMGIKMLFDVNENHRNKMKRMKQRENPNNEAV